MAQVSHVLDPSTLIGPTLVANTGIGLSFSVFINKRRLRSDVSISYPVHNMMECNGGMYWNGTQRLTTVICELAFNGGHSQY